jgi:hypothetical protein
VRTWISLITIFLIGLTIFLARSEITKAVQFLASVNFWILLLMIPVQFFSYYANGKEIFLYLRSKGHLKDLTPLQMMRMSMEFNFVNHILPSGGASGASYFAWQVRPYGVRPGRATMAQIVRTVLKFLSFLLLLIVALILLTIDHRVNRVAILLALILTIIIIVIALLGLYIISKPSRLNKLANWITKVINKVVRKLTRGKKRKILSEEVLQNFFSEMHEDYLDIKSDKKILLKPFLWTFVENISDAVFFYIAFMSFGVFISPAAIFIAFGLSAIGGSLSVTPGGSGVYEAIMIGFLASAGVSADIAIAGTILGRIVFLAFMVIFGYTFYQLTILRNGNRQAPAQRQ